MATKLETGTIVNIRAIVPDVGIEAGYNIHLADHAKDPGLKASAAAAIGQFNHIVDSFQPNSPEGLYLLRLRLAANSLARGIERRKDTLEEKKRTALEKKERMIRRITQTERLRGVLIAGCRLLLLSGFGFALAKALLEIPGVRAQTSGTQENLLVSIASALGFALIGSFVRSVRVNMMVLKTFREYDQAITAAQGEYVASVIEEYELAAETARQAWVGLTGQEPPMTAAFRNLLIDVMGGAKDDRPPEPEKDIGAMLRDILRCALRRLSGRAAG